MKNLLYLFVIALLISCSSNKKTATTKTPRNPKTLAIVKTPTIKKGAVSTTHHGVAKKHEFQQKYLPYPFKYLYLGMPIEEFKKANPKAKIQEHNALNYRIVAEEFSPSSEIKEIIYYFDTEDQNPLFELIIEYNDTTQHDKVVKELYGEPNFHNNRWKIDVHEGFDMMIWEHETKLVIVGKIDHTEYTHKE